MTYAQGGLVQASDYNGFATTGTPNLNQFWSTGSGSSGYGQPGLPTVAAGSSALITSSQWVQLFGGINKSALHQGTAITQLPIPGASGLITYVSTLQSALNATFAGRLNAAAVGTDITSTGTRTANWGGSVGLSTVASTITVTFSSASAARYFFNAGGTVSFTCSRTGGTGSANDVRWSTLCSNLGTLGLPAVNTAQTIASSAYQGLTKFGGGGFVTVYNRQGYYNLTTSPAILYTQYLDSSAYYTDRIVAKYSTTGSVVTIRVEFIDTSASVYTDTVTGNLSVTGIARPPSSVHLSNTWGTPIVSVTAPA